VPSGAVCHPLLCVLDAVCHSACAYLVLCVLRDLEAAIHARAQLGEEIERTLDTLAFVRNAAFEGRGGGNWSSSVNDSRGRGGDDAMETSKDEEGRGPSAEGGSPVKSDSSSSGYSRTTPSGICDRKDSAHVLRNKKDRLDDSPKRGVCASTNNSSSTTTTNAAAAAATITRVGASWHEREHDPGSPGRLQQRRQEKWKKWGWGVDEEQDGKKGEHSFT